MLLSSCFGTERELAKQRRFSLLKQGDKFPSGSIDPNGENGRTRDIVAKNIGYLQPLFKELQE